MTTPENLPVLEALHSTPSRRYLSDQPISDDVLWAVLDAAICGPSGGNRQSWGWVVVRDPAVKERIAGWYREGWDRAYGAQREKIPSAEPGPDTMSRGNFLAAEHLAMHLAEAPVWVFPVLRHAAGVPNPRLGS